MTDTPPADRHPLDTDAPHPPFAAAYVSYWREGRMSCDRLAVRECPCPGPHLREVMIEGKLLTGEETGVPGLEGLELVWRVVVRAPDAEGAADTANTIAKALGFQMNPIFHRD